MTTFTNITRTPIHWEAPVVDPSTYYFKIDDTYYLDIGSSNKLVTQTGSRSLTSWTPVSRTPVTY